jgi:hypothetical protein
MGLLNFDAVVWIPQMPKFLASVNARYEDVERLWAHERFTTLESCSPTIKKIYKYRLHISGAICR